MSNKKVYETRNTEELMKLIKYHGLFPSTEIAIKSALKERDFLRTENELLKNALKEIKLNSDESFVWDIVDRHINSDPKNECLNCGDNRQGKGSLIFGNDIFCNEFCYIEWSQK